MLEAAPAFAGQRIACEMSGDLHRASRVAAAVAAHVDYDARCVAEAGQGGPEAFHHVVDVEAPQGNGGDVVVDLTDLERVR